jgi:DNA-binding response OmpR family regulator
VAHAAGELPDGRAVDGDGRRVGEDGPASVVMVSAHDDELEKVRALQAGADDHVTKPFGAPAFVRHAGRTLSAEQLLDLAWDDPAGDPRRVKVYVGYLRAKLARAGLDPAPIETVRGFGYRYRPPPA